MRGLDRVENVTVTHQGYPCHVELGRYSNGRTAICLVDKNTGEPHATATTNLVNETLGEGEVFIKDYSENAGMMDALEEAKVASRTGRVVSTGYASAIVAKLLIPVPALE